MSKTAINYRDQVMVQLVVGVPETCPQQVSNATIVPPCGLPVHLNDRHEAICSRHGIVAWPRAKNGSYQEVTGT